MMNTAGELGLLTAMLVAALGFVAGIAGWRGGRSAWIRFARLSLLVQPVLVGFAVAALLVALLRSDMHNAYVAGHTERSLPNIFKCTALWAGQEGSLLAWGWLLALVCAMAAWSRRQRTGASEPVSLAVLAGGNLFFAVLLVFAAQPFALTPRGPLLDGAGLHPALQHWAMVLHPPILLLGYTLSIVPFAVVVGGLATGEPGPVWMTGIRRWALASWLFLTAGILLGAWWAYTELGWGGYWGWDPVENASLLPWLTGTALLHTLVLGERRGTYRGWAALLASMTLALCVVGTLLTRSGLLGSVHAYGEPGVSLFFLGLLVVIVIGAGGLMLWRRQGLRSAPGDEGVLSRTNALLTLNLLLIAMAGATLFGTIFPLLSRLFVDEPVSVGVSYYSKVVVPMALAVAAVMALAPVLRDGEADKQHIRRRLLVPVVVTGAALLLAMVLGVWHPTALVCIAIASMTFLVIAAALLAETAARAEGRGWLAGLASAIGRNPRKYGGQLAHTGLVLVILGVCGSSVFAERSEFSLAEGESGEVGGYSIRFESLQEIRGTNYNAMEAVLVATDHGGREFGLGPQHRYYDKSMSPVGEVAVRSRLTEDLYVVLDGWEPGGQRVTLGVLVNPLVAWIWVGGLTMVLGGSVCLLSRHQLGANNDNGELRSVDPTSGEQSGPPADAGHRKETACHVQDSG